MPDPFNMFLSGGAGIGKSFFVNLVTECLKKTLKYAGRNCDDHPSVVVTASTGKAATNINGTILYSAFSFSVREGSFNQGKLGNERLYELQMKYKHLTVLLFDEISMIGKETFEDLNKNLQKIMNRCNIDFGGVSILLIGNFCQLPPLKQKTIFSSLTPIDVWFEFEIHKLTEIVRQISDPHYAQLLNKLREGKHTQEDIDDVKALNNTDTSKLAC